MAWRRGEFTVDRQDLETREREGWWKMGTLAMHWRATSSGRFGRSWGDGGKPASLVGSVMGRAGPGSGSEVVIAGEDIYSRFLYLCCYLCGQWCGG